MTDTARFAIGAQANCSDGSCGEVCRLLIDPAARTVTHLVIGPRNRPESSRLVPTHLIDATAEHLRLRCSMAEFGRLDPAEEIDLVEGAGYGGGFGQAEAVQGYGNVGAMGAGGGATGMGIGMGTGHHRPVVSNEVVPEGETDLRDRERVHAVDGEIGRVQGFLVDLDDNRMTHVLLQEGHLWGRKEVAIPVSAVTGFGYGIRLNLTKKQVEDLPPV